jgi:hypothetical protein
LIVFVERLFLLTVVALVVTWVGLLLASPDPRGTLSREAAFFVHAFPSGTSRIPFARHQRVGVSLLPFVHLGLPEGGPPALEAMVAVSRLHVGIALRLLPYLLLSLASGLLLGGTLQERIRFGSGYASPAVAFVAKRLLGLCLFYLVIWSLAPIPVPYWTLYLAMAFATLGSTAYLGNLPLRL